MHSIRRKGAVFGALSFLVLSSCMDNRVVQPDVDATPGPSLAIVDGTTSGSSDFYFLPPISEINPNPQGEFNPFLRPSMRVCVIDEVGPGLSQSCEGVPANQMAAYFGPGEIEASSGQYQIGWDTGTRPIRFRSDDFLLLEVLVGDQVMGSMQLDPQDPQGPGQSDEDAYPFRIGETIPVKFWLSQETLCTGDVYVDECITGAVIDQTGGSLVLEDEGNRLGVIIYANALPAPLEEVIVTVERINPLAFLNATGTECIPGLDNIGSFDAPQFGDCFRVLTNPLLPADLEVPALVSICLDPTSLSGLDLTQEQQDQLTMVRFDDDSNDEWEALADAFGDCPTQTASLMDVPEDGFFRYAAMGVNAMAGLLLPEEVEARDLRLGGLTSSFSRFRYALPGQMVPTAGDGVIIQSTDSDTITATVNVVDHEGVPVENATVTFTTTDGTVSSMTAVSDAAGDASITWVVDTGTPGDKTLTASALGLTAGTVPEHDANYFFTEESVTFTATVVGPPAQLGQMPDSNIDDAVAGEPQTLTVIVTDADGNRVEGVTVAWTCTGSCDIPATSVSDENGEASVTWTPYTSGSQASVASVGIPGVDDATFTATVAPAAAGNLTASPSTPQSALIGSAIPLSILVTDIYGNLRGGDLVTWSVTSGGGLIQNAGTTTASDGTATADWILGPTPGANTASVSVAGLSASFEATGQCFDGWGSATTDGVFGASEWACANSATFTANLSGGSTEAEIYWMNDADDLYLAVRVRRPSLDNANSVRFDFDNDGDGVTEVLDDAIGFDGDAQVFIDEHLSDKCLNRNQSGCGVADASTDGSGGMTNDGTWTTYELAHPLSSGESTDFSLAKDDVVGFFLTLQQGNGAQGNTQFPDFRLYESIRIVGY